LPRCENRRWILSKALPRIYGDRLDVTAKHDAGDGSELLKALNGKTRGLSSEDSPAADRDPPYGLRRNKWQCRNLLVRVF
jgi:hypothetical protein